jgi:hypothetical protein
MRMSIIALLFIVLIGTVHAGDCINSKLIRTFEPLSDRHLFIEETGKRYSLLTLQPACLNLRNTTMVAIKSPSNFLCSGARAEIIYRDAFRPRLCNIMKVESVENIEQAKSIANPDDKKD